MKHPRLYVTVDLQAGAELVLASEPAQHLRVLRLQAGNPITLFNGDGGEYLAELIGLDRRVARVRVERRLERDAESPLRITLIQGVSKGERMEFTIQKAVELGVHRIAPVLTTRSVVQLDAERMAKREQRWRGIIASACEQCGRNRLPELMPALPLTAAWPGFAEGVRLVLNPQGDTRLGGDLKLGAGALTLLVGPEGGLTEGEVTAAEQHGFLGLRLGPRILRTETAGLAALAALQVLAGDLA